MARPSPSCAHDDDRLRLSPASPPSSNSAGKKESTAPRLSQLCPPCATPSSNSSLDYRRSDARIVEDGFAAISGVSKSAKVVLIENAHPFAGELVGSIEFFQSPARALLPKSVAFGLAEAQKAHCIS